MSNNRTTSAIRALRDHLAADGRLDEQWRSDLHECVARASVAVNRTSDSYTRGQLLPMLNELRGMLDRDGCIDLHNVLGDWLRLLDGVLAIALDVSPHVEDVPQATCTLDDIMTWTASTALGTSRHRGKRLTRDGWKRRVQRAAKRLDKGESRNEFETLLARERVPGTWTFNLAAVRDYLKKCAASAGAYEAAEGEVLDAVELLESSDNFGI